MVGVRLVLVLLGSVMLCGADDSETVVRNHVAKNAKLTFREPAGFLPFPYLVPAGPYNQLWDWDSVFTGVGLLEFGSAPYLAGSMKNFLFHTNLTTGEVQGCLTPDGSSGTIYHAKPVVIQGAWLSAVATNNTSQFLPFREQMKALLSYWIRERRHDATGLYVWHDQLETGADNLPISICPSPRSDCWNESIHAYTISSTDIMVFLQREFLAYAKFCDAWSAEVPAFANLLRTDAAVARKDAEDIAKAMEENLWCEEEGRYLAFNISSNTHVTNRVYLQAFPAWLDNTNTTRIDRAVASVMEADMLSPFGIRSTSNMDPRYNNDNIIVPYSNWRGPIWIIANTLIIYGIAQHSPDQALELATRVIDTLAEDVRATGSWHECYHADKGVGLAADGFLSWNTLGASLLSNLRNRVNPFVL